MIADRFRHALQSGAARQAAFEERARLARIGEVQRAVDDLREAALSLGAGSDPVALAAAAHFEMAAESAVGGRDVAELVPWVPVAVRLARAVNLGDRGQS